MLLEKGNSFFYKLKRNIYLQSQSMIIKLVDLAKITDKIQINHLKIFN